MAISKLRLGPLVLGALLTFTGISSAQQNPQALESAKKEGEVVWYGTLTGGSIVSRILSTFETKNPNIKIKYLRLGGAGFLERIRTEARAGKFFWDVVTSEYIQFFELSKQISLAKYARSGVKELPGGPQGPQRHLGEHLWRNRDDRVEYSNG